MSRFDALRKQMAKELNLSADSWGTSVDYVSAKVDSLCLLSSLSCCRELRFGLTPSLNSAIRTAYNKYGYNAWVNCGLFLHTLLDQVSHPGNRRGYSHPPFGTGGQAIYLRRFEVDRKVMATKNGSTALMSCRAVGMRNCEDVGQRV